MTPEPVSDPVTFLCSPLMTRATSGRAGLVVALLDGTFPTDDLLAQVETSFAAAGLAHEVVRFSALGDSPISELVGRCDAERKTVFSVLFDPESLNTNQSTTLDRLEALNLQRSRFAKAGLAVIFWIPHAGLRLCNQFASNFLDYRLRTVEVPAEWAKTVELEEVSAPHATHNLPFPSLGSLFVGREDALAHLGEQLSEQGVVSVTQPVSIQGLGGGGQDAPGPGICVVSHCRLPACLLYDGGIPQRVAIRPQCPRVPNWLEIAAHNACVRASRGSPFMAVKP